MKLDNIKGNTFYIKGGTNTGIYLFDNNKALMIDPGLCGSRPKKVIQILESKEANLEFIINTHEHNDHYGACNQLREHYEDIIIMSSADSKLYIENPKLFSNYIVGGRTNEFINEILRNRSLEEVKIDRTLNEGKIMLEGCEFEIIEFRGHAIGSIGVITKDNVIFVGDLLIGEELLNKYDFLFIFDIEEYLKSLDKIKNIYFEYLVLGHGKNIISKEESYELIEKHEQAINKYLNQVRNCLKNPMTLEKVLKNIIKNNKLSNNYKEYQFYKTSLVSLISYLADKKEIDYILEDGDLYYYTKKNQIMIK